MQKTKKEVSSVILTIRSVILIVLISSLIGCGTIWHGGAPAPSFDVDKDLEQLAKHFGEADTIAKFYQNPTKEERNKFISGRLVMMNIHYIQFLRKMTSEKQFLDSAVDILTLSLNLAGAAVGSAGTKTILSSIAAGVTGSKISVDKNYYYEKTVPALVAEMNAKRKQTLIPILEGIKKDLDDYPFTQAVTDLHNYYFAGTLIGAIQAIQADAGISEQKADEKIEILSQITEKDITTKGSLTDAIRNLKAEDFDKVKNALKLLAPLKEPPADFESAKSQLQSHVRNARTPEAIQKVNEIFKKAQIIQ